MSADGAAARTHRRRGRGWWRSVWFVLPLVVAWLVPMVVLLVAAPRLDDAEAENVAAALPDYVVVGERTSSAQRPVMVQFGFAESGGVAVRTSGLVTGVGVLPGDAVRQCRELVAVDGVPVLAFRSDSPLYRDLAIKDEGEDVEALTEFLQRCKVLDPGDAGSTFSKEIEAAVKKLQVDVLRVKATGVFSPTYVAYVPKSATVYKSVQVAVGTEVAPGTVVAAASGAPTSASLLDMGDGQPLVLDGGDYALRAGDAAFDLPGGNVPADSAPELYEFVQTAVADGVAFASQSGMTGEDPAEVGGGTEQYGGMNVSSTSTEASGTVTATAVHTAASGASCLVVVDSVGTPPRYRVEPLGGLASVTGEVGVVVVPSALIGLTVVRDPTVLSGEVLDQCA